MVTLRCHQCGKQSNPRRRTLEIAHTKSIAIAFSYLVSTICLAIPPFYAASTKLLASPTLPIVIASRVVDPKRVCRVHCPSEECRSYRCIHLTTLATLVLVSSNHPCVRIHTDWNKRRVTVVRFVLERRGEFSPTSSSPQVLFHHGVGSWRCNGRKGAVDGRERTGSPRGCHVDATWHGGRAERGSRSCWCWPRGRARERRNARSCHSKRDARRKIGHGFLRSPHVRCASATRRSNPGKCFEPACPPDDRPFARTPAHHLRPATTPGTWKPRSCRQKNLCLTWKPPEIKGACIRLW